MEDPFTRHEMELSINLIRDYKLELEDLFKFNFEKFQIFRSSTFFYLDNLYNLIECISKGKNDETKKEQSENMKAELLIFKSTNYKFLKNLLKEFRNEYKHKHKNLRKIIEKIDSVVHDIFSKESFENANSNNNLDKPINAEENFEDEYIDINYIGACNAENILNNQKENKLLNSKVRLPCDWEVIKNTNNENNISNFSEGNHPRSMSEMITLHESKKIPSIVDEKQGKFMDTKIRHAKVTSNRPANDFWKDKHNNVNCAFCGISSGNLFDGKKLGCLYGPFQGFKESYYAHEKCAIYSPKISLDSKNMMKNVIKEIERSRKIICKLCKNPGANIFCYNTSCKDNFHYLCGKKYGCLFDNQKFYMNCPEHLQNRLYENDLNSDIVCEKCFSGLDEEVILLCSKCDKSYHTYCLVPKLFIIPEGDWYCDKCK